MCIRDRIEAMQAKGDITKHLDCIITDIEMPLMDGQMCIRDRSGADIVFCVGPQMMPNSLKVAVEHPEVYILNCSLNAPHPYILSLIHI